MEDRSARARLTQAIEDRALELDLTWTEVADRSDMTEMNWRRIRSGAIALTKRSMTRIERALDWQPGSVAKILAGGQPDPIAAPAPGGAPMAKLSGNPLEWTPQAAVDTLVAYQAAGPEVFWGTFEWIANLRRTAIQGAEATKSSETG